MLAAAAGSNALRLNVAPDGTYVLAHTGAWSTLSGGGGGPQRVRSRTFPELSGTSMWLLPADSRLRRALYRLVTSRWFDYAMFALIILNCVAMAYEYPDMSRGDLDGQVLFYR
jgi:hypothetical protein